MRRMPCLNIKQPYQHSLYLYLRNVPECSSIMHMLVVINYRIAYFTMKVQESAVVLEVLRDALNMSHILIAGISNRVC